MKIKYIYLGFLISLCFIQVQGQFREFSEIASLDFLPNKLYNELGINFGNKHYDLQKDREIEKDKIVFKAGIISLLMIIILMSAFTYYRRQNRHCYYRRQHIYRIRLNELFNERSLEKKQFPTKSGVANVVDLNISETALNKITEKLKLFIREKQYLDNDVSLNNLAKAIDTNPKYLSQVINFYEQKSFSAYIRELRINYAVEALKTNTILRKYAITSIAKELGFNNAQSFSRAFYEKTGIYPSCFIRELEKEVFGKKIYNNT